MLFNACIITLSTPNKLESGVEMQLAFLQLSDSFDNHGYFCNITCDSPQTLASSHLHVFWNICQVNIWKLGVEIVQVSEDVCFCTFTIQSPLYEMSALDFATRGLLKSNWKRGPKLHHLICMNTASAAAAHSPLHNWVHLAYIKKDQIGTNTTKSCYQSKWLWFSIRIQKITTTFTEMIDIFINLYDVDIVSKMMRVYVTMHRSLAVPELAISSF